MSKEVIAPVIEAPAWLMESQPEERRSPEIVRQLTDEMYGAFFETVLDKTCNGISFQDIIEEDPRKFDAGKMMYWIKRDPERKQRFYEAQEVFMEMVADQVIAIADAKDNPLEDVSRSSLRIDARLKILKSRNRDRYGDNKKIEVSDGPVLQANHLMLLSQRLVALQQPVTKIVYDDVTDVIPNP